VALKVLPFAAAMDPTQLRRFQTEALAAAQLHHTHIVPVYSVGCERGVHYYAMQFIEGQTLAQAIAERRRMEETSPPPTRRGAPDGAETDRRTEEPVPAPARRGSPDHCYQHLGFA
jgi:serine/threonine protein kinase